MAKKNISIVHPALDGGVSGGSEFAIRYNEKLLLYNNKLITFNFPTEEVMATNLAFTANDMGTATVSLTVYLPPDLEPNFGQGWSLDYRGEIFRLKTPTPTGRKDTQSLRYVYDLVFSSERDELDDKLFSTFTQLTDGSLQVTFQDQPFHADVTEFLARLRQNLEYHFGTRWIVDFNPALSPDEERFTVEANRITIWEMLSQMYQIYGYRWTIDTTGEQMVIRIGYDAVELDHIFDYADGLTSIERTTQSEKLHTRIWGWGGTRNIPPTYFKNSPVDGYPSDPDANEELRTGNFARLQPSGVRLYVQGWNDATQGRTPEGHASERDQKYYMLGYEDKLRGRNMFLPAYADSSTIDEYGIVEDDIEPNENIFPTIQNVYVDGKGRIDEVVAVEDVLNDNFEEGRDIEEIVPSVSLKTTFKTGRTTGLIIKSRTQTISTSIMRPAITAEIVMSDEGLNQPYNPYLTGQVTATLRNANNNVAVGAPLVFPVSSFTRSTRIALPPVIVEFIPAIGNYYIDIESNLSYSGSYTIPITKRGWVTFELIDIKNPIRSGHDPYKETFDIWIKDPWGETGGVLDQWNEKLMSNAAVVFSSGLLGGDYEFMIAQSPEYGNPEANGWHIWEDTTKSIITKEEDGTQITVQSKWRIGLIKSSDEVKATNLPLPNTLRNAKAGDHFFFTNIMLPYQYVYWAEERLQDYLDSEADLKGTPANTYVVKPGKVSMASFPEKDLLKEGNKLRVTDRHLVPPAYLSLYINTLTIRYGDGSGLPDYDIVVSDKVLVNGNPAEILRGEILSAGGFGHRSGGLQDSRYLRKDGISDISYSPTTFFEPVTVSSGVRTADFKPGDFAGTGGAMYIDSEGATVLEADKIVARREMRVNEITVNQVTFTGGKQIFSAAGGSIERVEDGGSYWRCYMDTKMGTLVNQFALNDQAYHQDFNVEDTSIVARYYWRLVVGVGADYVDLSKTDANGSAVPQAGDDIAQLGNRNNTSRQAAFIIDTVRDGGGLVTWYDDINSYSLVSKDSVNIGRIDGKTWVQAFGNAYFGSRDQSKYMKYEDGQVSIRGVLVQSNSGDTDYITVDRGIWVSSRVYYQGDLVHYGGNQYVYIATNPSSGQNPSTSTGYWKQRVADEQAPKRDIWYTGIYDASTRYFGTPEVGQLVRMPNEPSYYVTLPTVGNRTLPIPPNSTYWEPYAIGGASFTSVAADVLYATNGHLGSFTFDYASKEFRSMETDGIPTAKYPTGTPNIILNSETGEATFNRINARGEFHSIAANGSRVDIDASLATITAAGAEGKLTIDGNTLIRAQNRDGVIVFRIDWDNTGVGIQLSDADSAGGTVISSGNISFNTANHDGSFNVTTETQSATGGLQITMMGLPTSSSGLYSGQLWRDGTTLRIVP